MDQHQIYAEAVAMARDIANRDAAPLEAIYHDTKQAAEAAYRVAIQRAWDDYRAALEPVTAAYNAARAEALVHFREHAIVRVG